MIPATLALAIAGALADGECDAASPQLKAAALALDANDVAGAEKLLAPLDSLGFGCPRVSLAFARMYLAKGDFRGADVFSEIAASKDPQNAEALVLRAQVFAMGGKSAQAAGLLDKAIALDPNNADAHFQLGKLLDGARKHPQAVAEFERTVKLRPRNPQAYDFLALNLERLGETSRAESAYRQGLLVNDGPRSDFFLDYNYGRLLLKLNRLDESKRHLDKALTLTPQVRAVHYDHAKLNLRLGNLQDARHDAEAALAIADPNGFILDLQIYNLLETICTKLGDTAGARRYADLSAATHVPVRARERD
jgi:tetratricopeptide (TPR) repeat protein